MKITKRKKALLGLAASTVLVLGACGDIGVPVYGVDPEYGNETQDYQIAVPEYGIEYDWDRNIIKPNISAPMPEDYEQQFYITEITDDIYGRIDEILNQEDCPVSREDLCYLHVLSKNWEGETVEGEMIVNKHIAEDILDILLKLYEADYRIENIRMFDNGIVGYFDFYNNNNSVCFITADVDSRIDISKNRLGLAVDINPRYNPYTEENEGFYFPFMESYEDILDERDEDYYYLIKPDDLCVQLFKEHGFEWGGDRDDPKSYMRFEIPDELVEQWYPGVLEKKK